MSLSVSAVDGRAMPSEDRPTPWRMLRKLVQALPPGPARLGARPGTSAAEPPLLPPGSRRTKRWPAQNGAAPGCSCCPPDQRESDPARLSPAGRDRPLGDEASCILLLVRAPAPARQARPETPVLRGCPP